VRTIAEMAKRNTPAKGGKEFGSLFESCSSNTPKKESALSTAKVTLTKISELKRNIKR